VDRSNQWNRASRRLARFLSRRGDDAGHGADALLEEVRALGELSLLLRAAQLAAQYGRADLARDWIEAHRKVWEEPGADRGRTAHAYRALLFSVDLASKDYTAARRSLGAIDWNLVPRAEWSFNLRLLAAAWENRHDAVISLLSEAPRFHEPYERATCLRILGKHFTSRGLWRRALGYHSAALGAYREDTAVDSLLKQVEALSIHGAAASQEGRHDEAEACLRRALRMAMMFRHAFYEDSCRIELAQALGAGGSHGKAAEMARSALERIRARGSDAPLFRHLEASALLAAASIALDSGDAAGARDRLADVESRLDGLEHARLRGHWRLLRGRLVALERSDDAAGRALLELDEAERCFRSLGDGDRVGLARVSLHRGEVHLKRRDLAAAVAEAVKCMEMARDAKLLPVQARCLLLESQLLLQKETPEAERIYEEVLSSLGAVHDPVVLFKVIANLYLHTWELDEQLDLTDWHLRQIHGMRDVLEPATFDDLYEKLVTKRVARRMLVKTFGVDPRTFPDED